MIDKEQIFKLINESVHIHPDDYMSIDKYRKKLLDALGNDKYEVVSFLKSIDYDTFYMIDEIYEELAEKFGDETDDIFCYRLKYKK